MPSAAYRHNYEPSALDSAITVTHPDAIARLRKVHQTHVEWLAETHMEQSDLYRRARMSRFGASAMIPIFRESILEKILSERSGANDQRPIGITEIAIEVGQEYGMDVMRAAYAPFYFDDRTQSFQPDYDRLDAEGTGLDIAFSRAYVEVRDWCNGSVDPTA